MSQQINLYRPIFRKQEKKFSAKAMLQAGAAMVIGIAVLYGVLFWQVSGAREELRQAEKRHAEATTKLETVTRQFAPAAGTTSAADRLAQLEQEIAARRRVQEVLNRGLFVNKRGYSDYLLALARQHVDGVWITSVAITGAGEDMKLQGRTVDPVRVPRYVQRLSAESTLAGKEFEVFLMTSDKQRSYSDFLLKAVPGADARGPRS